MLPGIFLPRASLGAQRISAAGCGPLERPSDRDSCRGAAGGDHDNLEGTAMSAALLDTRLDAEELTVRTLADFSGVVKVLGSKSYSNRYLAIASLSGESTTIDGALVSD